MSYLFAMQFIQNGRTSSVISYFFAQTEKINLELYVDARKWRLSLDILMFMKWRD
jgi:hypothetical protein